ncbi:MAG: hypothetical protein K9K21_02950 [Desulfotignum sp.]|nr:hypothetical protein [Desulfotignum sp.]
MGQGTGIAIIICLVILCITACSIFGSILDYKHRKEEIEARRAQMEQMIAAIRLYDKILGAVLDRAKNNEEMN